MKNSFAVTATGKSIFFINVVRDPFGVMIISYSSYWRFSCSFGTDSRTSTFCFTISYSCASVRAEFIFREKSFFFVARRGINGLLHILLKASMAVALRRLILNMMELRAVLYGAGKEEMTRCPPK